MKELMTIAALFVMPAAFASCDDEKLITESRLPAESRTFLKTHFDGVAVTSVVKEVDGFEKDYTVYLQNGFEVNFRRSGAWDEVEGHRGDAIPASILGLLPEGIETYTTANYPDRPIVMVNREQWGYEVELGRAVGTDGVATGRSVELDFTQTGDFFRYDD
jgi:hypothetical protein